MTATYGFYDITGSTGSPTYTYLGDGSSLSHLIDFKNKCSTGVAVNADAINRQDEYSFPLFWVPRFAGTFSSITNVETWLSSVDISDWGTGAAITGSVQTSYTEPVSNASTGDSAMPETSASALDLSQSGAGTIYDGTAGYAKICRMQAKVGTDATIGTYTASGIINVTYTET
jgi:hypothetical protein